MNCKKNHELPFLLKIDQRTGIIRLAYYFLGGVTVSLGILILILMRGGVTVSFLGDVKVTLFFAAVGVLPFCLVQATKDIAIMRATDPVVIIFFSCDCK